MKFSPEDPKLTAYVLGELDKAESQALEQELKNSAELRAAVEEIRATAEFLKTQFAVERKLSLSEEQKQSIVAEVAPANVIPMPRRNRAVFFSISAIAASVMFILSWGLWTKSNEPKLATNRSSYKYAHNTEYAAIEKSKVQETTEVQKTPEFRAGDKGAKVLDREMVVNSATLAHEGQRGNRAVLSAEKPHNLDLTVGGGAAVVMNGSQFAAAGTTPAQLSAPVAGPATLSYNFVDGKQHEFALKSVDSPASVITVNGGESRGKQLAGGKAQTYGWYYDDGASGVVYGDAGIARKIAPTSAPRFNDNRYDRSGTARYPQYVENAFESVRNAPLSTFSIDVDTASYANVRRFLSQNQLPPPDAVRVEELVNYFTYNYPQPRGNDPFSATMEVAGCPWNKQHRLVRLGLKGKEMAQDKRPPSNFVFLVDVSGSMSPTERLPLIKQALRMLVKRMTENDRIAMVVYASSSGVVLESTSCMNKEKILEAIDRLEAGGSTNGGQGIQRAYALAEENFIKGGVNRVILATDGDFNVGITDQNALVDLIQKKAKSGVFLTALGVGTDNYKDALMQKLADKGNGNYYYLDSLEEAQKVLLHQMNGTLVTIAKDVKIQIEFNPTRVQSYRLIGYEKRILAAQDFNNDKKDAGEIGAGHTVTALYEIVPTGVEEDEPRPAVDDLKYQSTPRRKLPKLEQRAPRGDDSNELLTLKLRYKQPDGDTSKLLEFPLADEGKKFGNASGDFRFATAVAGFGMLLKNSGNVGDFNYEQVHQLAESAKGEDKEGYRAEFINLVKKAKQINHSAE